MADEPDTPDLEAGGPKKPQEAIDKLERARLGEKAGELAGAHFADWQGSNLRKPEEALQALREIEKSKLILEAAEASMGGFADMAINSLILVGDLASNAIRRVEASKRQK